jgi:proteasome assembly chaperone 3
VPLSSASPTSFDTALPTTAGDMLPLGHLNPKTLLGAGGEQRETMGHLYASQIASTISTKNPEETRTVLVGLGLLKVELERESFFDVLELVQKVL